MIRTEICRRDPVGTGPGPKGTRIDFQKNSIFSDTKENDCQERQALLKKIHILQERP